MAVLFSNHIEVPSFNHKDSEPTSQIHILTIGNITFAFNNQIFLQSICCVHSYKSIKKTNAILYFFLLFHGRLAVRRSLMEDSNFLFIGRLSGNVPDTGRWQIYICL